VSAAALWLRRDLRLHDHPALQAAAAVYVSADFGPYGVERDARGRAALGPIPPPATGSTAAGRGER